MTNEEKKLFETLQLAVEQLSEKVGSERVVQMAFVDFNDGLSAGGMTLNYYDMKSPEGGVVECWLVGDEFVCVGQDGQQAVVPKTQARAWSPVHVLHSADEAEDEILPIDWLGGEHKIPLDTRDKLKRMKK